MKLWPYLKPREREQLTRLLGPRIDERFCPHVPKAKQAFCLSLDDYEVLFGGAAGGGKSDYLLMAYLQYVDMPHYRGLILRRKSVDLDRSEAILERAKSWWLPTRRTGVGYQASTKTFTFPSGAQCQFGHANNPGDEEENYQGGAWQFIAFDELTQFLPRQYLYLFSRLRRPDNVPSGLLDIPLRMRGASNPGGISHNFVRDRFMTLDYAREFLEGTAAPLFTRQIMFTWKGDGRAETFEAQRSFVPSKVQDGAVDLKTYIIGLAQQDPTDRERLLSGNWLINEAGRFKPEWFGRYTRDSVGTYRLVDKDGRIIKTIYSHECKRFQTVDVAGTEREMNAVVKRNREPSWSVISTWDYLEPIGSLAWLDVWREQVETPELMGAIRAGRQTWKPETIYIERDGIGRPVYQQLSREGLPVVGIDTHGKDKLQRSVPAANEAAAGRVLLPTAAHWLDALEAELFAWRGSSDEVCDQIDTFSHAAKCKVEGFVGDSITWGV